MRKVLIATIILIVTILSISCSNNSNTPEENPIIDDVLPISSDTPLLTITPKDEPSLTPTHGIVETSPTLEPTPEPTPTSGPTPTLEPDAWMKMPVIPTELSDTVYKIYELGQLMGNNPNAFSKVGDCHSITPYFLKDFDLGAEAYQLGEYSYLEDTILYFAGSFERESQAVKIGLSANAALSPLWNDWQSCETHETPLSCEYRIHKPSFVIISLGTNDAMGTVPMEERLRRVIEFTIGNGIVPILSTKADNAEGNNHINVMIAELAYEYEIPLWNFWAVVQPLPDHGRRTWDHLSYNEFNGYTDFVTPGNLEYGWPMRNLSALNMLDEIRLMILENE